MKTFSKFLLLLFLTQSVSAQLSYTKRIELELKDDYVDEKLYEFGSKGFVIRSVSKESSGGEDEWKYDLYDTDLNLVTTKSIKLNKRLYVDETYSDSNQVYTLFKNKKGDFSIVNFNVKTQEISNVEGIIPKKSYIKDMAILGDNAFFNALLKNKPYLFSVNIKTGEKKFIPVQIKGFKTKKLRMMNFQVLEESNEIFLYVKAYINRISTDIFIIKLNSKGEKEKVFNLTENISENITSVSASKLKTGKYIFIGTYSTTYTGSSEGIFFCQSEENRIDFIRFYNFLELKDFLSYLPERKQKKIEQKKKRKEARGKEYNINYRIADHELMLLDDGYLFLGEAYYPTYRTETYTTTTTVNGIPTTTTQTRTVFDGYRYTHAILAKIDKQGNLIWDNSFEMWPAYKPFYVKRFISVAEQNEESVKMVFSSWNKIVSKEVSINGAILQDSESDEIETGYSGDKSKRSFSNIDYWYNNYFIANGIQVIKNTEDENVKRKRRVFFISKIEY